LPLFTGGRGTVQTPVGAFFPILLTPDRFGAQTGRQQTGRWQAGEWFRHYVTKADILYFIGKKIGNTEKEL